MRQVHIELFGIGIEFAIFLHIREVVILADSIALRIIHRDEGVIHGVYSFTLIGMEIDLEFTNAGREISIGEVIVAGVLFEAFHVEGEVYIFDAAREIHRLHE